jgi:hypothetical protein
MNQLENNILPDDEKYKTILKPICANLEKLSKLRKIYFYLKDNKNNYRHIGLIASEIEKLYPDLIIKDEYNNSYIQYDKLSIIALEAIDMLYNENKLIKERLNIIENICSDLEERFIDIEYLIKNIK